MTAQRAFGSPVKAPRSYEVRRPGCEAWESCTQRDIRQAFAGKPREQEAIERGEERVSHWGHRYRRKAKA